MYKLIALDMDGTLLNDEKKITEKTKKAISEARNNGKYVVLCSGRPIEGIYRYLDELNMNTEDDYVKRIFLFVQTDKVKLSDSLEIIENMYK